MNIIPWILAAALVSVNPAEGRDLDKQNLSDAEIRAKVREGDYGIIHEVGYRNLTDLIPTIRDIALKNRRGAYAATETLAKMGDEKQFRHFLEEIQSKHTRARRWAVISLGFIGNEKAADPLIKLLDEPGHLTMLSSDTAELPIAFYAEQALGEIFPNKRKEFSERPGKKPNGWGYTVYWKEWWKESQARR